MNYRRNILPALICVLLFAGRASGRVVQDFDAGWLFSRGDFATAMMPAFDDGAWRKVEVPHDWSIEGPFSADDGSGNGYVPGGVGWYRKHFKLDSKQKGEVVTIEFDGVYDYSEVWINGQLAGGRPYGYSSFQVDVTPYVKFGADDNVLAVRVDHSRVGDSRYYTGSGIYRNVRLVMTDKLRIAHWGTYVTTPSISVSSATVRIETTVENGSASNRKFSVESDIIAPEGNIAASVITQGSAPGASDKGMIQQARISEPELWTTGSLASYTSIKRLSPNSDRATTTVWSERPPSLYTLKSIVKVSGTIVDETETPFGIRTATFDPNRGFFLNGEQVKLKGVCIHHDAGSLGAAVPEQVLERRLLKLKDIGVNAIRTSHNPPDPELLDLCDRLGFLVMDEAFDEFTPSKNKWVTGYNQGIPSHFGYGEIFDDWSVRDIQDLVRRDRNHPSIILWSIGNEVDYANDPFSDPVLGTGYKPENPPATDLLKCAKPLIAAVKSLDRTRPVTAALAAVKMSNVVGLPELLDVVGYNYQEDRYAADHAAFPKRIIYGSENKHTYAAWRAVTANPFIAGQFLWTGIDYLGEAAVFPDRGTNRGLLDTCGFKKPLGWFRQSMWSDTPMVYICAAPGGGGNFGANSTDRGQGFDGAESWNWPANSTVTVHCFTNCPEVTLTLNGKLIGTKKLSEAVEGVLNWQVPFESGTLEAICAADGKTVCEYALKTAGPASRIVLLPDKLNFSGDKKDVCQVEYRIEDENGVMVPNADQEVKFDVAGPARILGIGNGDLSNIEDCKGNAQRAFHGRGLAILETSGTSGSVTVTASASGLVSGSVVLQSQ